VSIFSFEIPSVLTSWTFFFSVSVVVCLIYPFFSYRGSKLALENKLGMDTSEGCAKYFNKAYNMLLNLISNSLYFPTMKSVITAFSCTYPSGISSEAPGYHVNVKNMERWNFNGPHIAYVGAACLAILAYYPLASVIYPNLQFA